MRNHGVSLLVGLPFGWAVARLKATSLEDWKNKIFFGKTSILIFGNFRPPRWTHIPFVANELPRLGWPEKSDQLLHGGGSPLFLGVKTSLKSLTSFAERFCHSEQKKGYPPVQQFVQTVDTTRQIKKLLIWILREKVLFWEFSQKCSSRISLYKVRFTFGW